MPRTILVLLAAIALHSPAASAQTSSDTVPHQGVHFAQADGARSPGWARFLGGFVSGTAALAALYSLDEDDLPDTAGYALYTVGTAAGTGMTTLFWERPKPGIVLGAAIGALPLIAALAIENDGAAGVALLAAWIGAPLGASMGQR